MDSIKILPDTSAIVNGALTQYLQGNASETIIILLSRYVLAEIEMMAATKQIIGRTALTELKKLREASEKGNYKLEVVNELASFEIKGDLSPGLLDAQIRRDCFNQKATLVTSDGTMYDLAQIEGITTIYLKDDSLARPLIEKFFNEQDMMSVHLTEGVRPRTKRGKPGQWLLNYLGNTPTTKDEIEQIAQDIIEKARRSEEGFIEIDRVGCTIIQLGSMRIVISRPPFSKKIEITAVRPIKHLSLTDYDLSASMKERLETAEGVLVAGSPGAGKTTFACALAEEYASKGRIVKTIEKPRDIVTQPEITQYSLLEGDISKTADALLLVRPDYVLYDEIRDINDFKAFSDLRLAGTGVVGVIHASSAVDAIQRFIGKIELGIVPQIVDTVIYIQSGAIDKVLKLRMTVKVPFGMQQSDLARPVIVISDFETGVAEYELYVFGENTVLMPIAENSDEDNSVMNKIHSKLIESAHYESIIRQVGHVGRKSRYEVTIHPKDKARVIGKRGKHINEIEDQYGVVIQIYESRKLSRSSKAQKESTEYNQSPNTSTRETEPDTIAPESSRPIPIEPKTNTSNASWKYLNPSAIRLKDDSIIVHFPGLTESNKITIFDDDSNTFFEGNIGANSRLIINATSRSGTMILAAIEKGTILYFREIV